MLSPIGILQRPEGFDYLQDRKEKRIEKATAEGKKPQTMPGWLSTLMKFGWEKKISPFGIARFAGKKRSLKSMGRYAERRNKLDGNEKDAVRDYLF